MKTGLLTELWLDLQEPEVLWQAGVLLLCFALAWLFDRQVQARFAPPEGEEHRARAFGRRSIKRLSLPLAMLLLVVGARPILAHWHHVNLLSLAIPLLVSLVVIRTVMFIVRQSFFASAVWMSGFERVLVFCVWGGVALHILGVLPELIDLLESVKFTLGKQKLDLWLILQGLGAVLATLLVALWVGGLLEARLMNAQGIDGNVRIVLSRLLRALLIVLAVLIGLPLVGIDLTTLSVFGGALGVGLGFGLQKIMANYVSGFIILLDRSIRLGSLIEVANQRGIVKRITTRYTLLRGQTGVEVIVPNELLVSSMIVNETLTDPKVRLATQVAVAYETDLERALVLLVEAAKAQPRVLGDPPPRGLVTGFGESGINLEVGFWIADPEEGVMGIKSDIHLAIWKAFKAEGIAIPFPQREVRMLGV